MVEIHSCRTRTHADQKRQRCAHTAGGMLLLLELFSSYGKVCGTDEWVEAIREKHYTECYLRLAPYLAKIGMGGILIGCILMLDMFRMIEKLELMGKLTVIALAISIGLQTLVSSGVCVANHGITFCLHMLKPRRQIHRRRGMRHGLLKHLQCQSTRITPLFWTR
eukprot:GDKI01029543.1.p1 GENE.GDKI01029543.1~~GDKI01029543.1.p1  ORF type:complete len:165 (-),score=17.28 GDKI01029543.1:350-844(-)